MLGFEVMDLDLIRSSILSLEDFNPAKVDKYLMEIVKLFRDDDKKKTLNQNSVMNLKSSNFDFSDIFDDEVEEKERQMDEIDEKLEETRQVLSDVEKRRKEIILRKNEIRSRQATKSGKMRSSGRMG
jgi:nucleoside-triphosphatase THEP1